MREVLPGIRNRTLAIGALGTVAASVVGFWSAYTFGGRTEIVRVPFSSPGICLIPIAGQMDEIRRESRESTTPICDEKPLQPAVIRIPKELLTPTKIPLLITK
ncbi:hypothetical protein A3F65_01740 [Candidatus Saccharibacteria bacterium RIFCSPHIGHO2_12_FULL_47_16b]|nr:MAG: hypothetical protein A3F65_01740 [Candidatus Saccharibacteria bacterium RIFCSPHIGHO2_12_FULL_47_16b]